MPLTRYAPHFAKFFKGGVFLDEAESTSGEPEVKYKWCPKHQDSHPTTDFYNNARNPDGLSDWCKAYHKEHYLKKIKQPIDILPKKRRKRLTGISLLDQPTTIQKMVMIMGETPKISYEDLANKVGIKPETVRKHLESNEFLRALRGMGSQSVTRMIPEAVAALRGSLGAQSEDVKLKAATKVLENERILGPERLDVTVNDLSTKKYDELVSILENAPKAPPPTLEAEVVS